MGDRQYQDLEKKIHRLEEADLRCFSSENQLAYGSAAVVCKAIVDKVGLSTAADTFDRFQKNNNIELTTSAYFDAEHLEKASLPIPVRFLRTAGEYAPGEVLECRMEVEEGFVSSISRRDWVGLFQQDWKYLHSYITFEWITTPEKQKDGSHVMVVKFNSKNLPAKPKDEGHVLCYVTRTGDVIGVSSVFHFRHAGISFTDADTLLVEENMISTVNLINIDMPSLPSIPDPTEPLVLSPPEDDTVSMSAVLCPNFQEVHSNQETLEKEREKLSFSLLALEDELSTTKKSLVEKDGQITDLDALVSELKIKLAAKAQHQDTIEKDSYDKIRDLEKQLTSLKIEKHAVVSLNEDLESKISSYTASIAKQEHEIIQSRQQISDSESLVSNLQEEILQKSESTEADDKMVKRCRELSDEVGTLEYKLELVSKEKEVLAASRDCASTEIHKLKVLVKSKDDVIDKLVCNKRESDGSLVTLKSETGMYKDEAKRLLKEINSCIGQLKKTEEELHESGIRQRKMEEEISQLHMLKSEGQRLHQKVVRLEEKNKSLEQARISLQDGEIATGTVLSLQARIAHLEHINSQFECQQRLSQITDLRTMCAVEPSPAVPVQDNSVLLERLESENVKLREELQITTAQLAQFRERAEDIEISFREGIKDLREQLGQKLLEVEEKNERLADKGELLDGMRAENQERRENERYLKHRLAQSDKKIQEEADSYHQIINDLQSQLSGYTNAHIQFEKHGLVKCPFCPAAYQRDMQDAMEQHIQSKHPF